MIDQLLRPKVAFWAGLSFLIAGYFLGNFLIPNVYLAAQSIRFPLASQFASFLVGGLEFLAYIARLVGPALLVGALILLKIERMPSARSSR